MAFEFPVLSKCLLHLEKVEHSFNSINLPFYFNIYLLLF